MSRQSVQRERNRVPFESASVRRVLTPLVWCWWILDAGDAQWIYAPVCASTFYAYFAVSAGLKQFGINLHRAPLQCHMHRSTAIGNPSQVKAKGGQRSQQASMLLKNNSRNICCVLYPHADLESMHRAALRQCRRSSSVRQAWLYWMQRVRGKAGLLLCRLAVLPESHRP